jgi:predicted XRE-type DNA-binding protein
MAKPRPQSPRVARGSGNVFADLALPDADTHLVKASLVSRIDDIVRERRLTQVRAAVLMGLKQPDVSRLLSGEFRDFSIDRLLRLLIALDRDIDIVIRPKPPRVKRAGRMQVVAA